MFGNWAVNPLEWSIVCHYIDRLFAENPIKSSSSINPRPSASIFGNNSPVKVYHSYLWIIQLKTYLNIYLFQQLNFEYLDKEGKNEELALGGIKSFGQWSWSIYKCDGYVRYRAGLK